MEKREILTQNIVAENISFQIGFTEFNYNNNKDTDTGLQMLNELNLLKDLSLEEKNNTDLYFKINEVFTEDYKNNILYEEDGKTFTNKSIEKALDLYADYKLDDFVNTVIEENINKANELIRKGINEKNDDILNEGRNLLNPSGGFKSHYENYNNPNISEFRELCIKSRLAPTELLKIIENGGASDFNKFRTKYVPFERNNSPVYTIKEHNKNIAMEEALNTSVHLNTKKKMETTNEKKENITVQGNVAWMSELKGTEKKYVDISIATNKPGEQAEFKNVRIWEDTANSSDTLKVGDYIKLEGYEKTLPKVEGKDEIKIFNATKVNEVKPIEKIKLTGNLGSDPEIKSVAGKDVATLSMAVKNPSGEVEWKRVQLWEKNAELALNLKKGDTVTIEGKEGKPYNYKKGEETLTTKDIIASSVEKHVKKTKEELNAELISFAQKGDYKEVSNVLKKGADSNLVTDDHLKNLSDKQKDAIKNTIRAHNDFKAADEKKIVE